MDPGLYPKYVSLFGDKFFKFLRLLILISCDSFCKMDFFLGLDCLSHATLTSYMALEPAVSIAHSIQFLILTTICLRSILMLSSTLRLSLPSFFFLQVYLLRF